MKQIQIHFDCQYDIGFGHFRRALTIAEGLQRKSVSVQLVPNSENERIVIPSDFSTVINKPDAVIFDGLVGTEEKVNSFKKLGIFTLALDYFESVDVDLVISVFEHKKPIPQGKRKSGWEYILIRPDIRSLRGQTLETSKNALGKPYALVVIGGGDHLRQSEKAALKIAEQGLDVALVLGPLASSAGEKLHPNAHVFRNPDNFTELMSGCEWGVTNGGGCFFEMLCLEKPVFVLPQTEMEETITSHLREKSAVLGVGLDSISAPSSQILHESKKNINGIVDGEGASRIIHELENALAKRK